MKLSMIGGSSESALFLYNTDDTANQVQQKDYFNDAHGVLSVKVAPGTEDDGPGELVIDRDVQLGASEIQALRDAVRSNRFWRERIRRELTVDGSDWTIEIRQGKTYHFDSQISPKEGSIRNIGMYLIELSGLELTPQEIH